jgi:hypothetical protein
MLCCEPCFASFASVTQNFGGDGDDQLRRIQETAKRNSRARASPGATQKDLAWLRTKINAHSDPLVRKLIAKTEAEIAAILRGDR